MKIIIYTISGFVLSIFCGVLISVHPANARVQGWDPGNIMSDSMLVNSNSMDITSIQQFLNSKVQSCDTYGQQTSEYGGPDLNGDGRVQRWEWGKSKYNQTTFPCIKDYTENDGRSAARVIYDISLKYQINPQVLIVLLQKEQALITDTWPLFIQYRTATGYACPDTAPCDSRYYGLVNQLDWSAKMFRAILENSSSWYTPYIVGNNYVRYNPNASCGGSNVYIQNRATQALYSYTPYQPNQATLDADWGSAPCGAYGNRNFYLYFNSWFGNTRAIAWQPLQDPRLMTTRSATRKIDPSNLLFNDSTISSDTTIKFTTKTIVNGKACLRTAHDTIYNNSRCIYINDLDEINIQYELLPDSERLKAVKSTLYKQDIRKESRQTNNQLFAYLQIEFEAKTTVNSVTYYVTKHDYSYGFESGIPISELLASTPYEAIDPDWTQLNTSVRKVHPTSLTNVDDSIVSRSTIQFTSRKQVGGVWYYRTQKDTRDRLDKAIAENYIDFEPFSAFQSPRWMTVPQNTTFLNPFDGETSLLIEAGTQLRFTSKINVNGTDYFRIESDTNTHKDRAVLASKVNEINFNPLILPRYLILTTNTKKYIPSHGIPVDDTLNVGTKIKFVSKITINGITYYRTEHDTQYGNNKGIPSTLLQEI